jgi:hypothetical protein
MDELYTMDRPRQMRGLPKLCGAAQEATTRLLVGRVTRVRYKAIRTAPLAGCTYQPATSECYLRPIE